MSLFHDQTFSKYEEGNRSEIKHISDPESDMNINNYQYLTVETDISPFFLNALHFYIYYNLLKFFDRFNHS